MQQQQPAISHTSAKKLADEIELHAKIWRLQDHLDDLEQQRQAARICVNVVESSSSSNSNSSSSDSNIHNQQQQQPKQQCFPLPLSTQTLPRDDPIFQELQQQMNRCTNTVQSRYIMLGFVAGSIISIPLSIKFRSRAVMMYGPALAGFGGLLLGVSASPCRAHQDLMYDYEQHGPLRYAQVLVEKQLLEWQHQVKWKEEYADRVLRRDSADQQSTGNAVADHSYQYKVHETKGD